MYLNVTKVCIYVEPDPVTHDTSDLDQHSTYYMLEKLQNGHIFYTYNFVFEHGKV